MEKLWRWYYLLSPGCILLGALGVFGEEGREHANEALSEKGFYFVVGFFLLEATTWLIAGYFLITTIF